jgi:hypothetical protein
MSDVSSREMIFIIIISFLVIIPMAVVETKYSLGIYILFSIIIVILVRFAALIYYKGDPPKRPYRKRRVRPFTRDPVFIIAVIAGISSLILLNTLYK